METFARNEKIQRRKRYDRIRADERCRCGGFKWRGHSFCRACTNLLPPDVRSGLFTSGAAGFPDAYDRAAQYLDEKGA